MVPVLTVLDQPTVPTATAFDEVDQDKTYPAHLWYTNLKPNNHAGCMNAKWKQA
jgi:hypothetical protein